MPRPDQTPLNNPRPFSVGNTQSPGVGVFASPVRVLARDSTAESAAQLASVLGAVRDPLLQDIHDQAGADASQGMADEVLGKTDPAKAARVEAYAQGAHRIAVLNQYQQAERNILDWYQTEADKTAPVDQIAKHADAMMREELGGLEGDPAGAKLVATRYTSFLNQLTGQHIRLQHEDRVNTAVSTTQADIMQSLARGGDGDYQSQVEGLYKVIGDRTQAVNAVLQSYGEAAVQGHDPGILDRLPKQITGDDGKVLPGPAYSAKNRDLIDRYRGEAQKLFDQDHALDLSLRKADVEKSIIDRQDRGASVSWKELTGYMKTGDLTESEAVAYWKSGLAKRAQAQMIAPDNGLLLNGMAWMATMNQPRPDGGTYSKEYWQTKLDQSVAKVPAAQQVDAALALSRSTTLPFTPLKTALSSAGPQNGPQVVNTLDLYRKVKAAGLLSTYVPDAEARAVYEYAARLQDGGESPAAVQAAVEKYDPQYAASARSAARPVIQQRIAGGYTLEAPWLSRNVTAGSLGNRIYADRQIARSAELLSERGMAPDDAFKTAVEDFKQTHYALRVSAGQDLVLPKEDGVAPEVAQRALDWGRSEVLVKLAEAQKIDPSSVHFSASPGMAGRGPDLTVVDDHGRDVGGVAIPLHALLREYMSKAPDAYQKALDEHKTKAADVARMRETAERAPLDALYIGR